MAKATKLLAAALCSSIIFTGCGSAATATSVTRSDSSVESATSSKETNSLSKSTSSSESVASSTTTSSSAELGISGTTDYTIDGLKVPVPNEYGTPTDNEDDYKNWDISEGNNTFRIDVSDSSLMGMSDDAIMKGFIEYMYGSPDAYSDASSVELNSITPENIRKFKIGDYEAVSFEVTIPMYSSWVDAKAATCYTTYVLNTAANRLDWFMLAETDVARNSYKDSYYKMIEGITKA